MMDAVAIDLWRGYPPRVTEFTARFWDALGEARLLTTRCPACRHTTFPPKPLCPRCWRQDIEWVELAVDGTLYSWTRVHASPAVFEPELPYALGVIDLDGGIRLALRLHEPAATDWACGQRVRLLRLDYIDGPLLAAAPA